MPYLKEHRPELVAAYEGRYKKGAFVSEVYRKRISELINSLRRKHGMIHDDDRRIRTGIEPSTLLATPPRQMSFFDAAA